MSQALNLDSLRPRLEAWLTPRKMLLVLALVHLAVFAPTLWGGFVYDDHMQIENNPYIRSLSSLPKLFEHKVSFFQNPDKPGPGDYYRPLHMAAYALIYAVTGDRPWGFHLANLGLGALASFLLFLIVRRAFPPLVAALAAMLFALQPVHVETVAWMAALPELLCAVLVLGLMALHRRETWSDAEYALGALLLFAALLTRENALVFPGLALVYDLSLRRDRLFKDETWWARYLAYGIAILAYLFVRTRVLGHVVADASRFPMAWPQILLNLVPLCANYLVWLLIPLPASAFHVFHPIATAASWKFLASLGLLALAAALGRYFFRNHRGLWFWLLWIPLTLLPFLYLPALGENVLAERYAYLPSAGACVLLAYGAWRWGESLRSPRGKWVYACGLAVGLLAWAGVSWSRSFYWQNDATLAAQTLRTDPDAYPFVNILGYGYFAQGREAEAEAAFKSLSVRFPRTLPAGQTEPTFEEVRDLPLDLRAYRQSFFEAQTKLAALYFKQGRLPEAEALYLKLAGIFPADDSIQYYIGLAQEKQNRPKEARRAYEAALRLNPNQAMARERLGSLAGAGGDPVDAWCEQARVLAQNHQTGEAIDLLNRAAAKSPKNPKPHHYLFNVYWMNGQKQKALAEIREALRLDPTNQLYQFNYQALQKK